MADLMTYRIRIGRFNGGKHKKLLRFNIDQRSYKYTCILLLILLIIAGDVEQNPGPTGRRNRRSNENQVENQDETNGRLQLETRNREFELRKLEIEAKEREQERQAKEREQERQMREREQERQAREQDKQREDQDKQKQREFELKKLELELKRLELTNGTHNKKTDDKCTNKKLPKLEIGKFDGDPMKWPEFWDSYEASIHLNDALSDIDKFSYLKSLLVNEAKRTIEGISLTKPNYKIAIETLKKRYNRKQPIIFAHLKAIINLPVALDNINDLRYTFDESEKHIRCLTTLGIDEIQFGIIFVALILNKLPENVQVLLNRKNGTKDWSLETLRKYLEEEIVARESAEANKKECGTEPLEFTPIPTGALIAREKRTNKKVCVYCRKEHFCDECTEYSTIRDRKNQLKNRCNICFSTIHNTSDCDKEYKCYYCKKLRDHHRSLCPNQFPEGIVQRALLANNQDVVMQTATTNAYNLTKNKTTMIRILLDTGSHRSYITKKLAKMLDLSLEETDYISLQTFGTTKEKLLETPKAKINIKLQNGMLMMLDVNVVPEITGSIQRKKINIQHVKNQVKQFKLADSFPHENETVSVDLLIGNDYYLNFIGNQKVRVDNNLYLLESKLGWILTGRMDDSSLQVTRTTETNLLVINRSSDLCKGNRDKNDEVLENFWKLETIGISDSIENTDDNSTQERFNQTITFQDGRYQVKWPWKSGICELPDNYGQALGRFKSLARKFEVNEDLLFKYNEVIQDQIKKGIIEKVTTDSDNNMSSIKHYIPHHPVITPSKLTTKLRIVYDASARANRDSKSLNDCLHRGPVILQDLCGLLMRLRLKPIVITADIEKAFLQVGLQEPDRDVTRFFWFKDASKPQIDNNTEVYRFTRVAFGIVSSPFLLGGTIIYHLNTIGSKTAQMIKNNLYVDNVILSVESREEAMKFYKEAKWIFSKAGMNLREWNSNDTSFLDLLPKSDRENSDNPKVLGLMWDRMEDTISVPKPHSLSISKITRREILQSIASIYDPLGYFSPVTIRYKILLQNYSNLDWDEKVIEQDKSSWIEYKYEIDSMHKHKIQRFIGLLNNNETEYILVAFCDASVKAYATTIYLIARHGTICHSNLIFAKNRLAPKKNLSIPRLEVLAIYIAVKALKFVKEQIRVKLLDQYIFSDSQCALYWLTCKKRLTTFTENRLREIKKDTVTTFRYINTKSNPADLATRGLSTKQIINNNLWWYGPEWLRSLPKSWPNWNMPEEITPELRANIDSEVRQSKIVYTCSTSVLYNNDTIQSKICSMIKIQRYSSLTKLLRVTAWIKRFLLKLTKKENHTGYLKSVEITAAKKEWELHIQHQCFKEAIVAIKTCKRNELKDKLGLLLDDEGLLRCSGRLINSDFSVGARYPKLLPAGNKFTDLVIMNIHKGSLHIGISQTLAQLRQEYWLVRGRAAIRKVIYTCQTCKRFDGGAYQMPKMPVLPKFRVSESTPYTYTGLDYFGPVYIKEEGVTKKVWICLFTCLVVRAIHLEVIKDMSAKQFLMCLRRFVAKYGSPTEIICDNAPQFKLTKSVLDKVWQSAVLNGDVQNYVSNVGIKFTFIVEFAPWMGGFYERLIGHVKQCMRKSIGKANLTLEELQTVVVEVQAVVNSRPLVYVDEDIDSSIAITPAHFLTLNPKFGLPGCGLEKSFTTYEEFRSERGTSLDILVEHWRKGCNILQNFWKLWREEYLLSLRERANLYHKQPRTRASTGPKPGDVILVKDSLPRAMWRIGRIQEVKTSTDGGVRSATVQLPKGNIIRRPVSLLYPIEINNSENDANT